MCVYVCVCMCVCCDLHRGLVAFTQTCPNPTAPCILHFTPTLYYPYTTLPLHPTATRLQDKLAPLSELANVHAHLKTLNQFDIELFEYAQSLVARRLTHITDIATRVVRLVDKGKEERVGLGQAQTGTGTGTRADTSTGTPARCSLSTDVNFNKLPPELDVQLGIHRPPKHKAPLL